MKYLIILSIVMTGCVHNKRQYNPNVSEQNQASQYAKDYLECGGGRANLNTEALAFKCLREKGWIAVPTLYTNTPNDPRSLR